MSLPEKKESRGHSIAPLLGEPVGWVPIKKRPVVLFEQPLVPATVTFGSGRKECDANENVQGLGAYNLETADLASRPSLSMATPFLQPLSSSNMGASVLPRVSPKTPMPSANGKLIALKQESVDHVPLHSQSVQINCAPFSSKDKSPPENLQLPALDLNVSLGTWEHLDCSAPEAHDGKSFSLSRRAVHEKNLAREHSILVGMNTELSAKNFAASPVISSEVPSNLSISLGGNNLKTIAGLSSPFQSTLNSGKTAAPLPMDSASDVTLDLQLKLPSRPELGKDWKEENPPDLSLSLFAKEPEAPPKPVKSEPLEVGCQMRNTPGILTGSLESLLEREVRPEAVHLPTTFTPPFKEREGASTNSTVTAAASASTAIEKSASLVSLLKEATGGASVLKNEPVEELTRSVGSNLGGKTHNSEESRLTTSRVLPGRSAIGSQTNRGILFAGGTNLNAIANNNLNNDVVSSGASVTPTMHATDSSTPQKSKQNSATPQLNAVLQSNPRLKSLDGEKLLRTEECKKILKVERIADDCLKPVNLEMSKFSSNVPADPSTSQNEPCSSSTAMAECAKEMPAPAATCAPAELPAIVLPTEATCNDKRTLTSMSQGSADMDCSDDDNFSASKERAAQMCNIVLDANSQATMQHQGMKVQLTETALESCSPCSAADGHSAVLRKLDENCRQEDREGKRLVIVKKELEAALPLAKNTDAPERPSSDAATLQASPSAPALNGSDDQDTRLPVVVRSRITEHADDNDGRSSSPEEKLNKPSESPSGADVAPDTKQESCTNDGVQLQSQAVTVRSFIVSAGEQDQKADSFTSSLQNQTGVFVDRPTVQIIGYQHVNRNERWDRFMGSQMEKGKDYRGGRHETGGLNFKRPNPCGDVWSNESYESSKYKNSKRFQASRSDIECEIAFSGNHPMLDGAGRRTLMREQMLIPRYQNRRMSPPMDMSMPRRVMRGGSPGRFSGMEMPDRLYERADNFLVRRISPMREFLPHPRRAHSPSAQVPPHLEMMQRGSATMERSGRFGMAHRHPFHDEIMRRPGSSSSYTRMLIDEFGAPVHPTPFPNYSGEVGIVERRRAPYLRPAGHRPNEEREEMMDYTVEGELIRRTRFGTKAEFIHSEGGSSGSRDTDGRTRNRNGGRVNRLRSTAEQEDGSYRSRGPWRDGDGTKRKRY